MDGDHGPHSEAQEMTEARTDAPVSVQMAMARTVNYAMQQNDVPVISRLRVTNTSAAPLDDLCVRIQVEPAFASAWETRVASLAPAETYDLGVADIPLSHDFLARLTERVSGAIHVEVAQGEQVLCRRDERIDVLAYDEWGGLSVVPEILAAFVTPNHPAIEGVLAEAADVLRELTGDASLSGYQSRNPSRVATVAAAIYTVLQRRSIRYINPPASFEESGQKIRLPDRILENRLATCLDLAVLTAACIEQAGLNTLIVVKPGHALAGLWLTDECFADSATDSLLAVRKRVELNEICVIETAALAAQPPMSFPAAVSEGKRELGDSSGACCVIDVRRTRRARVRPLPILVERPVAAEGGAEAAVIAPVIVELPGLDAAGEDRDSAATETPATRLDRWKRKLLDLTLNNRLLNFRETKKTLGILCPDLPSLEDALAAGERFKIHPRPSDLDDTQPRLAEVHLRRTGEDALDELLKGEFEAHRLRSAVPENELNRRLLEIFREARTSLEESGANTLYLALGFLAWYEHPSSTLPRRAPIILVPLEIERHSVREGFSIVRGDDEAMVNSTLLELLMADFGLSIPGMDPVPQDEHGVDVRGILNTFRRAVKTIDRWEVVEEACIGLFSFTKFLMWRDLQVRSGELTRNKVVAHLINTPNQPFPTEGDFPDSAQLDDVYMPDQTFCPLSADSSQLAAVYAAGAGRTFVLHGPPGTGKSQTISNLIAHALANGKTVLFVAEKMAALNVVRNRLEQCGLGPFCLELHSNKSRKLEVIQQMGRALNQVTGRSSEDWLREANRLAALRQELNAYVRALHAPRATGESVFTGMSRLIGLRGVQPIPLGWASKLVDRDGLERLRDTVRQFELAGSECGHPATNVWAAAGCEDWSPGWRNSVGEAIRQLQTVCAAVGQMASEVASVLGMGEGWSRDDLEAMGQLAGALLDSPAPPVALVACADWQATSATISDCVEHGRKRDALREEIRRHYTPEVLQLDLDDLARRLGAANSAWALPRWLGRRAVRGALTRVARPGSAPGPERLKADLDCALALRREEQYLSGMGDRVREVLGDLWRNGEADWELISRMRDWTASVRGIAAAVAGPDLERAAALRQQWAKLSREGQEQLKPDGAIGRALSAYVERLSEFTTHKQALISLLILDEQSAWGDPSAPGALAALASRLEAWSPRVSELRAWCHWRSVRRQAVELGLPALVQAYESGGLPAPETERVLDRSFYQWWVDTVIEEEPVLRSFFSREFERKIAQFREVDDRYLQLTRAEIQARLAARVPQGGPSVSQNSELGILRRQMQMRSRHTPIRKLFQQIPNLLPRLKPCLLMSPISVAQYLDPAYPPFDLIVFDEASQMPVWDAVGAIARGSEVIVVGDPMQLPPTSFFTRADEEADPDDSIVQDLESILDDCLAAQLPERYLEWHYRSRHESLIAFSNCQYYDNRLLTFPSPDYGSRVSVRWIDGQYDMARSRTNRAEAQAVVDEIVRRLQDPDLARHTIGVVTFSLPQQTLVEDLLEVARQQYPEIEPYFAYESAPSNEPVFVKNLENVQGDERDLILFSICYGPDAAGRVSMNFGPLNRDGGHRRLNVAITRAREQVIVFSTLHPEQIDLSRTRARGVADLKAYLEYAERGPVALAERRSVEPGAACESPFEQQVCEALRARGYQVHPQVGCSEYRIDLAIVDPDNPGRYLLGIECDGANYHRAKTARDRDRLREGILHDLGWQLHRVWSTDWWERQDEELARIEAAIDSAKRRQPSAAQPVQTLIAAAAPVPPVALPPPAPAPVRTPEARAYVPFQAARVLGDLNAFYDPSSDGAIRAMIEAVVQQEGPVSLNLLSQRVAECWGIRRVAHRVRERIKTVVRRSQVRPCRCADRIFVWPPTQEPEDYRDFRAPGVDERSRRNVRDIPPEEIAAAALSVVTSQVSLPMADLIRETARLLGFQHTGQTVGQYISRGVDLLLERGSAVEQNGMIVQQV